MKGKKAFLREKFITFQKKIASLGHSLRQQEDAFQQRESSLCMGIFEILDALENIEESVGAREDEFDKTAQRLAKISALFIKSLSGCSKPMISS